MKRIATKLLGVLLLLLSHSALALQGPLFTVTSSGEPADFSITTCLSINGKNALSCETHAVHHSILSITTTIPGHTYLHAGFKINTPGYTVNNNTNCPSTTSGFTCFGAPISSTLPAVEITISPTSPTTPTVINVSPNNGPVGGGTSVTITGTQFTDVSAVKFGTIPATAYTVNSATSMTASSPAATAGTVDITVTTPAGTSATSPADQFNYTSVTLQSITITPPNQTIPKEGTIQFLATGTYSDGSTKDITNTVIWSSGSSTMASITTGGLATGLALGNVSIFGASGGLSGSASLTISVPTLVSIAVTPATASIVQANTQQFEATGTYDNHQTLNITNSVHWTSSIVAVATINSFGNATGVAVGSSIIYATSGELSGHATLTVTAPPTLNSITVTPLNATIIKNGKQPFDATGYYSDGSSANITSSVSWASSLVTVADFVGLPGVATGLSSGTAAATITATLSGKTSLGATLIVTPNTVPGAPTGVTAIQQPKLLTTSVLVSWVPPKNTGGETGALTYTVHVDTNPTLSYCASTNNTTCSVPALPTSVPHTFTVFATNTIGSGPLAYSSPITLVSPSTTPISVSPAELALSVNDSTTYAALQGNPRYITLTNLGTSDQSISSISTPAPPLDITIDAANCIKTLGAGSACSIKVTPGSTVSPGITVGTVCTSGLAATPSIITVSYGTGLTLNIPLVVLGYGCIYQNGYVFSVDDSTPNTGSIGGTVASQTNQNTTPIPWYAATSTIASIWGIDETSTTSSASPNQITPTLYLSVLTSGQLNCDGAIDGSCNTNNIYTIYKTIDQTSYAAGLCKNLTILTDWYLPSICEMGYNDLNNYSPCGTETSPRIQNMQSYLVNNNDIGVLSGGLYWSSTESSANPLDDAWRQSFLKPADGQSDQRPNTKSGAMYVRCVRSLTL